MNRPSNRHLQRFSLVLMICCSVGVWLWNREVKKEVPQQPADIVVQNPIAPQVVGAPRGAAAAAAIEQQLNGGPLTPQQRDAAQRRGFVTKVLARLNPVLAERSAGRQAEFEQIKQDFVLEHGVDFQDLAVLNTPFEFREVPIRMNPATRQFPGAGQGPIVPTMLTIVPRFN